MIRTSVGDNQLTAWADELAQLDEQINDLQTAKRDFYAGIRDNHGKVTADALKAAVKIIGMDPEKRAKAEEIDAETERFVQVLSKPRAPRATRTRENIEEFPRPASSAAADGQPSIPSLDDVGAKSDGGNASSSGGPAGGLGFQDRKSGQAVTNSEAFA